MKINELKRIAEENDYELSESPGYYKFTRKNRRNYLMTKYKFNKRFGQIFKNEVKE